jgi:hypothetical protein
MACIRNAYKAIGIQKRINVSACDRVEEVNWTLWLLIRAKGWSL